MSWYLSRTDEELVALASGGDRSARAVLVDRSLLPASRVAMHLEPDAEAAVTALVTAYRDTFSRLDGLADGERFLPVLLERLDHAAPFPLDPATHAPLAPHDRDRVRRSVLGAPSRPRAVPLAAVLAAAAVVALVVALDDAPSTLRVDDAPPAGAPADPPAPTAPAAATSDDAASPADDPSTAPPAPSDGAPGFDGGTGTGELAETR